jgi:hypothetical protein
MSIRAKRIAKLIIAGQWYTVALSSFEIVDMEFVDDDGNPIHDEPIEGKAYYFRTENKDEYYGPLAAIELFKLIDV